MILSDSSLKALQTKIHKRRFRLCSFTYISHFFKTQINKVSLQWKITGISKFNIFFTNKIAIKYSYLVMLYMLGRQNKRRKLYTVKQRCFLNNDCVSTTKCYAVMLARSVQWPHFKHGFFFFGNYIEKVLFTDLMKVTHLIP